MNKVWVLDLEKELSPNLIMAGKKFSDDISVISIVEDHSLIADLGVKAIYEIEPKGNIIDDYISTISNILRESASNIIILPNSNAGKTVGVALSEILQAPLATDTQEIELESDRIICSRMMYGGLAVAKEELTSDNVIITVKDYIFDVIKAENSVAPDIIKVELTKQENKINCLEKMPKERKDINLKQAKRIVAVGRGVKNEEDLQMMEELATNIGAELGCSRPISETEKWMPHERYIGISSVSAKPEVYMAIGISGQIQHMVAIKDSGKIIAINSDKNAPIFEYADYGIVGDLYKIVPKLIEGLK